MSKILHLLSQCLEKLLMLMMAAIVVTVTWQVFSRFALRAPSSVTEELARFLLIWIGILGAAYAYKTRAHLGLDLFLEKATAQAQKKIRIVIELVVLFFAASIMVFGGSSLVSITLELNQISAALGWQMGWIYSVIPLSGLLISLFSINNLYQLIAPSAVAGEL